MLGGGLERLGVIQVKGGKLGQDGGFQPGGSQEVPVSPGGEDKAIRDGEGGAFEAGQVGAFAAGQRQGGLDGIEGEDAR